MSGGTRGTTPPARQKSLRGSLMVDTVHGKTRFRAWPRSRKKGGTLEQVANQNKFMNAQRATKYFAPEMYEFFMAQVENSPLLPRDVMTMMLYNRLYAFDLPDGRTLWPMPAYQDVSQSLDVITNQEGQTMVRGANGWQPAIPPGPGLQTRFTKVFDLEITSAMSEVIITEINTYNECLIFCMGVTASVSSFRQMQVSTDNGMTFYNTSGDYVIINPIGSVSNSSACRFHTGNAAGVRWGVLGIQGINAGGPQMIQFYPGDDQLRLFVATDDPINALRISNNAGGNLTGGRLVVLAR